MNQNEQMATDIAEAAAIIFDSLLSVPLNNKRGMDSFTRVEAFEITKHLLYDAMRNRGK